MGEKNKHIISKRLKKPDRETEGINQEASKPITKKNVDQIRERMLPQKIDAKSINALVSDMGYRVKITKVAMCPNLRPSKTYGASIGNNHHNVDCRICTNGYISLEEFEDFAALTQNNLNRVFKAEGFFDASSFSLTTKSGILLQPYDIIEFPDITQEFYELIERDRFRDNNQVDRLRYKVNRIDHVRMIDAETGGTILFEKSNYELTPDGDIKWFKNKPKKGQIYVIRYKYEDAYRVVQSLHDNRVNYEGFRKNQKVPVRLPSSYIIKKDFLIFEHERERNDPGGKRG